jgi:hypothetical protein
VPICVLIRCRTGETRELPARWATLLAENLRAYVSAYSDEAARSAADKIEDRLVGADDTPIKFDDDESLEVLSGLNAVCHGWHKSEGGDWNESP